MRHFNIPRDRILAASVEIRENRITDRLIRIPSGDGKPKAIHDVVRNTPDAAFGNSRWDTEMLAIAQHPVAINPNPDLEETARARGWTIYRPVPITER
jgi:phosphoserine phosphatase